MKPTRSQLIEWIHEEIHSARMYTKYGFPKIAVDEQRHARILMRELKKKM